MNENDKNLEVMSNAPAVTIPQGNAMVDVEQQRAISEVQGAIMLAKKFPRNEIQAVDKIMIACQRKSLAEQALYEFARGGTNITGPSIRLAECMAQNWGNLQYGIRELEQRNGESTVEAFCWDMETNVRQVKIFQVSHIRHTKTKTVRLEDPRDIYEMVANQGARRLRACILGIIPGDIAERAANQCEETLKATADTSPENLKKMLEFFSTYSVTKEMIEKRIQRRFDTITPAQLVQLKKIYTSLKDGMSSASDWFEMTSSETNEAAKPSASLKDKVSKAAAAAKVAADKAKGNDVPETLPGIESGEDGAEVKNVQ